MGKSSDRSKELMHQMWGTTKLVTDYEVIQEKKMLREIGHDEIVPKKHNFQIQKLTL